MSNKLDIYIGYDTRESLAFDVCVKSILKHTLNSSLITIHSLKLQDLRNAGFYYRPDDPLSSTEFTFSRFLVPYLQNYKGRAIFCDCDFLFTEDILTLADLFDSSLALQCCKHVYAPKSTHKMEGAAQHLYPRKNWSSLMLYNCSHESNQKLTKELVNSQTGQFLHRLQWLTDEEIGNIPYEWNWLVGWYKEPEDGKPKALHFTEGGPWHKGYENCEYADKWREYL
jgi:lipopolysaccharide biosynthesis glycosyltransferase